MNPRDITILNLRSREYRNRLKIRIAEYHDAKNKHSKNLILWGKKYIKFLSNKYQIKNKYKQY